MSASFAAWVVAATCVCRAARTSRSFTTPAEASATSRSATSTALRYAATDCSSRARAASSSDLRRKPWKRGANRPPPAFQASPEDVKRSDMFRAWKPMKPLSEIVGSRFATATPTRFPAATMFCSAPRRSGRRSSSAAGTPSGSSGTIAVSTSAAPRGIGPGALPSSTHSWCSFIQMNISVCGIAACVTARSDRAWLTSRSDAMPPFARVSNRSSVARRISVLDRAISSSRSSSRSSR